MSVVRQVKFSPESLSVCTKRSNDSKPITSEDRIVYKNVELIQTSLLTLEA